MHREKKEILTFKLYDMETNKLTEKIIGCAIEVHRQLGPGLLESAYEECLCYELEQAGLRYERQKPVPVVYKRMFILIQ